ncbi:MAG: maltose/maltodextrin ABC transporter substrate-binding protein MalE [Succinivibrionaceae bacterium]
MRFGFKTKIIIGLGTVFCFCSNVYSTELTEGLIRIWIASDKPHDGIVKVGKKFTEETGIDIKVEFPERVELRFEQEASRGSGSDIFMWAHDRIGLMAENNYIVPIEPSAKFKERFADLSWEAVKYKGKIYAYPIVIEALGLVCNKELIKNVPSTFEQFIELDKTYKEKGKNAIIWDYGIPYYTYPLLSANGGYSYKLKDNGYDLTDTGISNEGSKIGMNFLLKLIDKKVLPRPINYDLSENSFIQGNSACTINGPWVWSIYEGNGIDFSVHDFPTINGNKPKPMVGVLTASINASSPNIEQAKLFLENYLLTDEAYALLESDRTIGVAALNSYEQKQEKGKFGNFITVTKKIAEKGDVMPNVPSMMKYWSSLLTAIKTSVSKKKDIDDALKIAEKRVKQN